MIVAVSRFGVCFKVAFALRRSMHVAGGPWGGAPNRVLGPNIRDMIFKDKVSPDTGAQKESGSGGVPMPTKNVAPQKLQQHTTGEVGQAPAG